MKKVALCLAIAAGLLLEAALAAAADAPSAAAPPFVSRLKAQAGPSAVTLSWRNPKEGDGPKRLYRYTEEIGESNIGSATVVARLPAGQDSYQDSPPRTRSYYYALLMEGPDGSPYPLLIPFRNKTSAAVGLASLADEEELAAHISGIRATAAGDSITVQFQSSRSDRELLLFRSELPLAEAADLLQAFSPAVLPAGSTRYLDYPLPGEECYYAVVDAGLFKIGKSQVTAGQNATLHPVHVAVSGTTAAPRAAAAPAGVPPAAAGLPPHAEARSSPSLAAPAAAGAPAPTAPAPAGAPPSSIPLPYLLIPPAEGASPEGIYDLLLPEAQAELSPATRAALYRLLAEAPPPAPPRNQLELLPEEQGPEPGGETAVGGGAAGEAFLLRQIVRDELARGRYAEAEQRLWDYLGIRRSPALEARAHFYLGQTRYLQGHYQDALLEFLLARDQLYSRVEPWLSSCFRRMWAD
jgi:hypothetical protein